VLVAEEVAGLGGEFSTVFLKEHFSYRFVHTFPEIPAGRTERTSYGERK
jgi:hypothetical protein